MGLTVPANPIAPLPGITLDPYPDHVRVYGLPFATLAATAAGPVRFPWVVWSPGLLVEEATTNLVSNPAPASTTSYSGNSGTLALDSTFGLTRATSLTLTTTAIPANIMHAYATTVAATTYTFSVYAYTAVRPLTLRLGIDWKNSAGSAISTDDGLAANDTTLSPGVWTRLKFTSTAPALAVRAHLKLMAPSGVGNVIGDKFWAANWQMEAKGHATSYAEGAMATGYTWSGSADNSNSVRAASSLSYTLAINAASNNGLTICAWLGDWTGPDISRVAEFARVAAGAVYLCIDYTNSGADYRARTATGTATITTAASTPPTFLAATCDSTTLTGFLYQPSPDPAVDVPPVTQTANITAITAAMTTVTIGSGAGAGYEANCATGSILVFNASLDVGTLETMARAPTPLAFTSDPRIIFAAGIGTDTAGTDATALAATGTFQELGVSPGRLELTSNLTTILTAAQEAYTYRLALPLGSGYGVGSKVAVNGDTTLHTVGLKAQGLEEYVFFN